MLIFPLFKLFERLEGQQKSVRKSYQRTFWKTWETNDKHIASCFSTNVISCTRLILFSKNKNPFSFVKLNQNPFLRSNMLFINGNLNV